MKSENGFGLLEILVTLVLLGVGATGLVILSRNSVTTAQESRHYEVAMRLAESKLDEFRNFNGVVSATSPLTSYNSIVSGGGSKTVNDGGNSYSYNLNWTVVDQYWSGSDWQTTVPANYPLSYSGRKLINVTVGWTDNQGQVRSLQLVGAVSPHASLSQGQLNGGLDTSDRAKPVVDFMPGIVPDVVSVELEDGSKKETSKPLPTIEKNNDSLLVEFESTTHRLIDDTTTTTAGKQSLQDMATVYCSCQTKSAAEIAYLPGKPYFAKSEQVQYWQAGAQVSKSVGITSSTKQQAVLCGTCCREHYDVTDQGFAGYYAPLTLNRGKFILSGGELQSATSNNYIDACRFIRINGVYQPVPDWHLASLTVFSSDFLNSESNLANYQAYIAYVVKTHAKWQHDTFGNSSDSSWSTVNSSPSILSFNDWLVANRSGDPTTAVVTGVGQLQLQLISRGIYVDIMAPSYLKQDVFRDNDGQSVTEPILSKIPFQDVNMTLLSQWQSSDSSKGMVTNQPMVTLVATTSNYYGTYSRGRMSALNPTYSGEINTPITITAQSYQGNSGVVDAPVLTSDIDAAMTASVQVSIRAQGEQPSSSINGIIKCLELKTEKIGKGNDAVTVNSAIACGDASKRLIAEVDNTKVSCVIQNIGSPAEISYSCSGMAGSAFALTISQNKFTTTPSTQNLTLPASGSRAGACVLLVADELKAASPAPVEPIPASCNVQP